MLKENGYDISYYKIIPDDIDKIADELKVDLILKAILSREISEIRNSTLIINLPGSPKGAAKNLHVVMPVLKHGIDILKGNAKECAR